MKVVINRCWGGFGLSQKAYELLAERGVPVIDYETPEPAVDPGEVIYRGGGFGRDATEMWDTWTREDESRTDPRIVAVVEELGKEADGPYARLVVVEVPDDADWYIHEYGGQESIHETHRRWA